MTLDQHKRKAPTAIWATRVALFALVLILVVLVLHRLAGYPTGLLLNSLIVGFALSALAIVLGIVAFVNIWRTGNGGGVAATFGILLSLLVFVWPASLISTFRSLPMITDVTTDPVDPPAYLVLSNARPLDANSAVYPGAEAARLQQTYYPQVKPITIERSVEEAYELVLSAMDRLKWSIAAKVPPKGGAMKHARVEAIDKTLILGFRDDIVVRIVGDNSSARIDMRSSSRFGRHDFGANAARIENFAKMFKARLDATVAIAAEHKARRARARQRAIRKRPDPGKAAKSRVRAKVRARKRRAKRQRGRRQRKRHRRRPRSQG